MTYNADSLRVQKQDSTGTTKSIWDGQNILLDANASNVTQSLYSLNPNFFGNLLSQSRAGTSSFFQFDALGSTAALASSLGSLTDTYHYKAFGEAVDGSGSTVNPFRFVGQFGYLFDGDLLQHYLRARQYSSSIARFMSHDPLRNPWQVNSYRYCGSRPIGVIDPSGLQTMSGVLNGVKCFVCAFASADAVSCICWFMGIADLLPGLPNWFDLIECLGCNALGAIAEACQGNAFNVGAQLSSIIFDCLLSYISSAAWLDALTAGAALGTGPLGTAAFLGWLIVQTMELVLFLFQQNHLDPSGMEACSKLPWGGGGGAAGCGCG